VSVLADKTTKYFLPYQAKWILDPHHLKICEKGRQIGLSYADAYDSVRKAAPAGGRDVWVGSRDETQAKEYVRYCKRWANVLHHAAQDYEEEIYLPSIKESIKVQGLSFANSKRIYALSSHPDAFVGKAGAHVKLDEYALHKDQRQLFTVVKPVIQWGGTVSLISTHRGVATVFNGFIRDIKERQNRMGWSLHTIPIQRAVDDGLVERIDQATNGGLTKKWKEDGCVPPNLREWWLAKQKAECIDEEQWAQEYCCIPADESSAFITYEMIQNCQESNVLKTLGYLESCKNPLYVGLDVARKKHLCVIDVGELVGDVMYDRLRLELLNKKFSEIEFELYRILKIAQVKRACIDGTGLGMQLAERAIERFSWKVESVTFSGPVKESLAFPLRAAFEDRRLRISDDDALQQDLHGIKKSTTASNNIRFEGESDDSHCDRFWAKALRQHAADKKTGETWSALV
jgi:phage FluMu gp28-like protein